MLQERYTVGNGRSRSVGQNDKDKAFFLITKLRIFNFLFNLLQLLHLGCIHA